MHGADACGDTHESSTRSEPPPHTPHSTPTPTPTSTPHTTSSGAAHAAWDGRETQRGTKSHERTGRSKTGVASLPHVKLHMSAFGFAGVRQEHLDAVVAFAGAWQRKRMCGVLDALTVVWATGDLPEECRFLRNPQQLITHNKDVRG